MKRLCAWLLLWTAFFSATCNGWSQPGCTPFLASHIHTFRMAVDGDAERFPVIALNGNERLDISFDDMTHEYRRYTYRLEHVGYDGQISDELFDSDYLYSTADEGIIEDYTPSQNTSVQYTHYSFCIPNAQMKPKLSGNYKLTISTEDDNDETVPVAVAFFGVVDTQVGLLPTCSTNTEVDWNEAHQQVSLRMDCSRLTLRDAESEVKLLVMQNRRPDTAVRWPAPTAQNGTTLIWEHDRRLIFKAGNEYRKMEILSTRYPGMHGDHVAWFDPLYHYTLLTDEPRKHYLYDEDRNGLGLVRCEDCTDADTEADYVVTHFALQMLPRLGREVYVSGRWTESVQKEECRMHYNELTGCYEADILLKLGYYNYMYLCYEEGTGSTWQTATAEGDFYQTENEYEILAYYRPTGSRYWQLVGCVTPLFRP